MLSSSGSKNRIRQIDLAQKDETCLSSVDSHQTQDAVQGTLFLLGPASFPVHK